MLRATAHAPTITKDLTSAFSYITLDFKSCVIKLNADLSCMQAAEKYMMLLAAVVQWHLMLSLPFRRFQSFHSTLQSIVTVYHFRSVHQSIAVQCIIHVIYIIRRTFLIVGMSFIQTAVLSFATCACVCVLCLLAFYYIINIL